jgi:uncharacterized integral membrane protein
LTQSPRSAAGTFRKIVAVVILVPLAMILIAFAVANRQIVTVSFDPLSAEHPAATVALPQFALSIILLILGVLVGGIAGWLRHGKWRRMARRYEREVIALRGEIASLRNRPEPSIVPSQRPPAERLQLKPPMR